MADVTTRGPRFRFGPFELDVRAGELRKHGIRLRLREQPFQILLLLLENPGEIVLREEIRRRLWPNNTIVEFDHGINTAVKKLRDALGESAEEPRYIERVARRGYRFLGEVEAVGEPTRGSFLAKVPVLDAINGHEGQVVAHYRVLEKLGSGGMGVVHRGEDVNLGRPVALKFLPEEMAQDECALARFRREARAASALNHPNICTIYEIGDDAGRPFIAMELLEGEDLSKAMSRLGSHMEINRVLSIAVEIAAGLETAHKASVIHRDIKPANIFITTSGCVKLLDFGVAKPAGAQAGSPANGQQSTRRLTAAGTPVGTPDYMSPEQARGEEPDARSDLYAFGLVLYEMATGRPRGPDVPVGLHRSLDRIVRKALEDEPEKRFQSAAEMRLALLRVQRGIESRSRLKWIALAGAASFLFIGSGLAWKMRHIESVNHDPAPQVVPLTTYFGAVWDPTFSPDGNLIAYGWRRPKEDHADIYLQQVGAAAPLRITTEPVEHFSPAFSPDGRTIAHFHDHKLMSIPTFGGAERKIADLDSGDCAPWIDYAPDGGSVAVCERVNGSESIVLISMDTGEKRRLTTPSRGYKDFGLRFSPDGRKAALVRGTSPAAIDIYVMPATGGEARRITTENDLIDGLAWTGDSREIVFGSGGGYAARLRRVAAVGGTPQPVAGASPGANYPAISRSSHRLAYVSIAIQISTWRLELLQPGNRPGSLVKLIASTKTDMDAQYSPDGRKIVFGSFRSGTAEIWVANDDGSAPAPLTAFGGPNTGTPHWSPDGKRIAFDASIEGNADIWIMYADGGSLRRVTTNPALDCVPSWSRDGRWIYFASNRTGDFQVWKVDPDTGRELQITRHGGLNATESPDGHVLYFSKSQDENTEVWKIPPNGGAEVAAMLSREGQPIKVAGWYYWHAFNDGIYFVQIVPGPSSLDEIRFFNFDTGKSTLIKTLTGYRADPGGLSVSSDRRWMLFAQADRADRNIMLVNNFR